MSEATTSTIPREGMQATVRNRRGLIASVEAFDTVSERRLHLVRVEYADRDGPLEETLLWEREIGATVLEPHALPRVAEESPMPSDEFDALVRATRWSALTPFLRPDGSGERSDLPIAAPFFGAVQVDDFQLVPLLHALQMPRVSLLLADDVGLGKTIEAGLILTELLIRRRIQRVLVLCPASLRRQWRREMQDKFALSFDIIDRQETHALQKRLGLDANPWRTFPRIISSYHYLRQPDVLEQFLATCRSRGVGVELAQLPWDLLIVDEAHNLMPANFGDDSDLAKMLRAISPWFEHKLFLTATPHNGHTRCFSGLLEQLDPVRFNQTNTLTAEERDRVRQVVVRRLKSEINELDDRAGRPRRFPNRYPEPVPLFFSREERELSAAVESFRTKVKSLIRAAARGEQLAGNFAVEVLSKRLLSSPATFAESWFRMKQGLAEDETAGAGEVSAARRAAEEELDDDLEREGRAHYAVRTIGAWLQALAAQLGEEIAAIDRCITALDLEPSQDGITDPSVDARFERLVDLIHRRLRRDRDWVQDERLIVFTEYKTTLDHLSRRLRKEFVDRGEAIRVLFGSSGRIEGGAGMVRMSEQERDSITVAFNDPGDPVRVLVATDVASEGLNLQETARLVLHYDIPWNPSKLEQRNGRLDRHGQARDVEVYHFTSEDDADLRFVAHVVNKVHQIREDLGSMGEVFDAAFQRRFLDQEDADRVIASLDRDVQTQRDKGRVERDEPSSTGAEHLEPLRQLCREIDLSPDTLRDTLEVALGWGVGRPRLEGPDPRGRVKLLQPLPPRWESLIDDSLRLDTASPERGALPGLIFDPALFIQDNSGRPVFRPAKDTALLHLGHPMFHQALAQFAQSRFPGGADGSATRWTVRRGVVPSGTEALVLLTVEELGVNELREPFHHWVRTLRLPVRNAALGEPLEHLAAADLAGTELPAAHRAAAEDRARELWADVRRDLREYLRTYSEALTATVRGRLQPEAARALDSERERFRHRLAEVERAMRETSLRKLEEERTKLEEEMRQLVLSEEQRRHQEATLRDLDLELERRRSHFTELLELLRRDQDRILQRTLPQRYTLRGQVQVYPVAAEIRLAETAP